MSVLSVAYCWPFAHFILHNGNFRTYFTVDLIWALLLAIMIFYFSGKEYGLIIIPSIIVIGSLISFLLYTFTITILYGTGFLLSSNLILGAFSTIIILSTYFVVINLSLLFQSIWACLLIIFLIMFVRKQKMIGLWRAWYSLEICWIRFNHE